MPKTVMPRFKRGIQYAAASLEYWVARSSRATTRGEDLELPGLGELDFDPKLDLGQDRVETGVAG